MWLYLLQENEMQRPVTTWAPRSRTNFRRVGRDPIALAPAYDVVVGASRRRPIGRVLVSAGTHQPCTRPASRVELVVRTRAGAGATTPARLRIRLVAIAICTCRNITVVVPFKKINCRRLVHGVHPGRPGAGSTAY
jgi:ribosomal protein S16